jgi:hypothetical protein
MDFLANMADYLFWIAAVIVAVIGLFVARYLALPVIVSFQTMMSISTASIAITLVLMSITALVFLYNKMSEFFDWISNYSYDKLPCLIHFLSCSGVLPALSYGLVLLKSSIATYFAIYLYIMVRKAMVIVSDQFWKLGVLLKP